jgi:hypothetical protein
MKPYKNQFAQPRDLMECDLNGYDDQIIRMSCGGISFFCYSDCLLESISDLVESELAVARIASRMEF